MANKYIFIRTCSKVFCLLEFKCPVHNEAVEQVIFLTTMFLAKFPGGSLPVLALVPILSPVTVNLLVMINGRGRKAARKACAGGEDVFRAACIQREHATSTAIVPGPSKVEYFC